jgi:alpha-L-fucosidase
MLLNVGPRPDGTITEGQKEVLLEIGEWLKVNGEAIYGSRPWIIAVEGNEEGTSGAFSDNKETEYSVQDIRFTKKDGVVYAICLEWSEEGVLIKSIGEEYSVSGVSMLGSKQKINWKQEAEGLRVDFPGEKPTEYAHILKIEF